MMVLGEIHKVDKQSLPWSKAENRLNNNNNNSNKSNQMTQVKCPDLPRGVTVFECRSTKLEVGRNQS